MSTSSRPLQLGACLPPSGGQSAPYGLHPDHLVTHGVVLGMTGSGKTGLLMVAVEEALRSEVPCILIDVKGDLPNLLLALPSFEPAALEPWVDTHAATAGATARATVGATTVNPGPAHHRKPEPDSAGFPDGTGTGTPLPETATAQQATAQQPTAQQTTAQQQATLRQQQLAAWGIGEADLRRFRERTHLRVLTPGSNAGEPLHILSSLERSSGRGAAADLDLDASNAGISAALSLVLRLLGRDPDPAKSREHVLLAVLAQHRLQQGGSADLGSLLQDVLSPPLERIGALPVEDFMSERERRGLASALNALLASPSFSSWRQGASLDVAEWLTPKGHRTPAVIVSVAHLDDEERALVLGVLLEEILAYTRSLRGTKRLRALVVLDEVYGLLPPHPANPPTKRPIVQLMKQGRAFGVGVLLASQNPMDVDYRALSNAGFWAVGRLQTDADRERVVESLVNANDANTSADVLHALLRKLGPRWFVTRNIHQSPSTVLLQPRWALSYLRGPMTLSDIRGALTE